MDTHCQPLENRRLFAAGDPLDSFGRHGEVLTPYESYTLDLSDIQPTPDGKLLASSASQTFLLQRPGVKTSFVRYNADGSPDTTFGGVGAVGSFFTSVRRITVRSDGRFYALGTDRIFPPVNRRYDGDEVTSNDTWYLARFKADGTLDRSFGRHGSVKLQLPAGIDEYESTGGAGNTSSILDADGKITLLAGRAGNTDGADLAVMRFDTTGAFDPNFNGGLPLQLRSKNEGLTNASIAVSHDGQTAVMADRGYKHRTTTVVLRLTTRGKADRSIGPGGLIPVSAESLFNPVGAFDQTGHLFVAGTKDTSGSGGGLFKAHVYKYNANGTIDIAFGGGDVSFNDSVGPITAVGDGGVVTGFEDLHYIHADGTLDAAFEGINLSSLMNVVVGRAVYGTLLSPEYSKNKKGKPIYRDAVVAVALDGNGPSPVIVSNKHVTFNGTSADDNLEVEAGPDVTGRPATSVSFTRNYWWTRTLPIGDVSSITVNGDQGSDDIRAFMTAAENLNLPITLNGGAGNDYFAGYGKNITAFGGPGTDGVYGDLTKDSDTAE